MRKLKLSAKGYPYGSKIVQNIVRARGIPSDYPVVLHMIFMWPGYFDGDDEANATVKFQNRRRDIPRCDCVHR